MPAERPAGNRRGVVENNSRREARPKGRRIWWYAQTQDYEERDQFAGGYERKDRMCTEEPEELLERLPLASDH